MSDHTYSLDDVAKHKSKGDLWMTIHNEVYDVSSYLEDHPGGPEVMLQYGGKDSSEIFESVGHSDDARARLKTLRIGQLNDESQIAEGEIFHKEYPDTQNPDRSSAGPMVLASTAAGVAGLVALSVRVARRTDWHHVARWFTSAGGPREQFAKGLLASIVLGGAVVGWFGRRTVEFFAPSPPPLRFEAFRKNPYTSSRITQALVLPKRSVDKCPLDTKSTKDFRLVKKEKLPSNSYRFVFGLPSDEMKLSIPIGQHVTLEASIEGGEKVSRPYTPASSPSRQGSFDLVVKVYPNGKMGNHLAHLEVGQSIAIRGPKGSMKYHRGWAKNLLMIAGGSGITPMFQLLLAICEDEEDKTKIKLLYGNATEQDILLKDELDQLAQDHSDQFEVIHILDKASELWKGPTGHVNKELIEQYGTAPENKLDNRALLCGPPGMVKAVKSTLTEVGYDPAQAISSMDDQVFCF